MQRTLNFRREHAELAAVADNILKLMAHGVAANSAQIRTLLADFSGLLKMHLAAEDKGLYPQLLKNPDEKLQAMAGRYMHEMGGLKTAWETYLGKWPATSIQANPEPFRTETTAVFQAIRKRMERENNELYNRIDSLTDRAPATL